jgi:hypothetical protein
VADFGLGTLEIFRKINFSEAAGIHKKSLDTKGLKIILSMECWYEKYSGMISRPARQ